jgi:acyl-CoA thioesterase I
MNSVCFPSAVPVAQGRSVLTAFARFFLRMTSRAAQAVSLAVLCLMLMTPPAQAGNTRSLLVIGDSLSAEYGLPRGTGWVALLEQRLASFQPGWTVVNASISGETTAGGASRIGTLLDRHQPAAVIVELGGNDALRGLDLGLTRRNLDRIVSASQQAGARVLLLGMQVPPNYGKTYTDAFTRVFTDVAQARKVDLVPFFLTGFEDNPAFFQPDRIHPNVSAQPIMLDNAWPAIRTLLDLKTPR